MKLEIGMNQVSASHTVYWTGKVVIGGAYQPPAKDQGKSAEAIQSALLLVSNAHPKVAPVGKRMSWKFEDTVRHYWALWRMSRRFGNPFWRKSF